MLHKYSDVSPFLHNPLQFFLDRGLGAGTPLVELRMGFNPVFLVSDAAVARSVLKASEEDFNKGRLVNKLKKVLGSNSLTLNGKQQRDRRAVIHKQLMDGIAGNYVSQITSTVREYAIKLFQQDEIDARNAMSHLALKIICNILFGKGTLTIADENAVLSAIRMVEDDLAEDMFRVLPLTPWTYTKRRKKLNEAKGIFSFIVERARKNASDQSLFRALEKLGLEGDALRDELLLIILAGHHTTGTAATWLLYHIGLNVNLSEQISNEAQQMNSDLGEPTPSTIKKSPITRALVFETLRLYPSSYWMSREAQKPISIAGYYLKKGTTLIISPWQIHRDPKYWDNPTVFDVNRTFTSKAFLPFGAGARSCVGMGLALLELQLIALEFSATFDIKVISPVPAPAPKASITLIPPDIRIRMELRDKNNKKQTAA